MAKLMGEVASGKHDVLIADAKDMPDISSCDLVIVGTPIYYEKPLPCIREFIDKNEMEGKKVALFLMSIADKFGKKSVKYTENRYAGLTKDGIKGDVIAIRVFHGWMLKEDKKTMEEGKEWMKRVLDAFENGKG